MMGVKFLAKFTMRITISHAADEDKKVLTLLMSLDYFVPYCKVWPRGRAALNLFKGIGCRQ